MLPLTDNIRLRMPPVVTICLIVTNVLVFFVWQGGESSMKQTMLFGSIPYELTHPGQQCGPVVSPDQRSIELGCKPEAEMEASLQTDFPGTWLTVFMHMFMHADFWHLLGNMLVLFALGRAVEDGLGKVSYVLFYLVGGFAAATLHTATDASSMLPMIGASGAISSVMAAHFMLYPRAKVWGLLIVVPLRLRSFWVIGGTMVMEVWFAYRNYAEIGGGGIAHFAHIGGFLGGALLVKAVVSPESLAFHRHRAKVASGEAVDGAVEPGADEIPIKPEGARPPGAAPIERVPAAGQVPPPPDPFARPAPVAGAAPGAGYVEPVTMPPVVPTQPVQSTLPPMPAPSIAAEAVIPPRQSPSAPVPPAAAQRPAPAAAPATGFKPVNPYAAPPAHQQADDPARRTA